jgi:hypothetical protein
MGLPEGLGVDLLHACRNRVGMLNSDAIWTHTEREHLAVSLLLKLWRKTKRPRLIANSVWLADHWHDLPSWKEALYRWLMAEADVLTAL